MIGQFKRLAHDHAPGLARKKFIDRLAVDDDDALACLHEDPRHRRLATPGSVILVVNHLNLDERRLLQRQ